MLDQHACDVFFHTGALLIAHSTRAGKLVYHDTALPRSCQVFAKPQIWARPGRGQQQSWLIEPSLSLVERRTREVALANRRSRREQRLDKTDGAGGAHKGTCMAFDPRVLDFHSLDLCDHRRRKLRCCSGTNTVTFRIAAHSRAAAATSDRGKSPTLEGTSSAFVLSSYLQQQTEIACTLFLSCRARRERSGDGTRRLRRRNRCSGKSGLLRRLLVDRNPDERRNGQPHHLSFTLCNVTTCATGTWEL